MTKKDIENNTNQVTEEKEDKKVEELVVEEKEPIVKKVIKYGLMGLAAVATGILGFVLGRNIGNDDDESTESEEKTEE